MKSCFYTLLSFLTGVYQFFWLFYLPVIHFEAYCVVVRMVYCRRRRVYTALFSGLFRSLPFQYRC